MNKSVLPGKLRSLLFYLVLAVIVFYLVFPFYWAINSSLKTEAQLQMTPTTFVPRHPQTNEFAPTWQNYRAVFGNERFLRGLANSAVVSVSSTFISLVIGSFAAFSSGK